FGPQSDTDKLVIGDDNVARINAEELARGGDGIVSVSDAPELEMPDRGTTDVTPPPAMEVGPAPADAAATELDVVDLELYDDDEEDDGTLHSEPTLIFKDSEHQEEAPSDPWKIHGVQTETVGRERELDQLRTAFKRAIETNHVQLVNIVGELGVGKSRLISEFNRTLDASFERANFLLASESSVEPAPFSIIQRLLRNRFYILDVEKGETAYKKFCDGVHYILGSDDSVEVANLISYLVGFKFSEGVNTSFLTEDVRGLRERASKALVHLLRTDAKKTPLILAFDNLEETDPESLALIDYLYTHLDDAPILLIVTGQPEFLDRQRSWGRLETLHLRTLDDASSRRLLRDILQLAREIPDDLFEIIQKKSGGHPLAIEGIVRYLVDLKVIEPGEPHWTIKGDELANIDVPLTLKGVVSARLENQTAEEIALLEKAAVIGNTFWFGALLMLYRLESEGWQENEKYWKSSRAEHATRVRVLLDGLILKDILKRSPDSSFAGEEEYAFKYAIERESILERSEPRAHELKHRMVANWLTIHGVNHIEEYHEPIARHWELGGRPERAAEYVLKLAESAKDRYANKKAIKFYERGLHLLSEDDYTQKLEIYHDLGNVLSLIADYEKALRCLNEMLRLAWIVGSRAKGGVAYNKMGRTYRELGEYDVALEKFQQSLALFDSVNDVRGIASNYDDIGRICWLKGDVEKALGFHRKSAKLRREIGDKRSIALSLNNIGNIYLDRGDIKHAVRCFKEALELRREIGDKQGLTRSLNNLAVIFYERGKTHQSVDLWREALRIAQEIGDKEVQGILYANIGEALLTTEQLDEAREHLLHVIELGEETGDRRPMSDAFINLGRLALLDGNLSKATEMTRNALAIAEYLGSKRLMGMAFKALGDIHANVLYDDDQGPASERDADTFYTRSIDILREISCEAELGKSLLNFGHHLIERGLMAKGREQLEQAAEIFQRLEMRPILERTRGIISELRSPISL
ncbi:MAG: tetratricopeptide repeat protein, partial [Myxococcales bacterium]|nr:tetratricopeptide repeat protein [Myxococcales bacterium]